MKSAPDFLTRNLFPNIKEITESFGAYDASKRLGLKFSDNHNVVCVGDGVVPRTAATFAFRSNWNCYSVDPKMRVKDYNIDRLEVKRACIQDCDYEFDEVVIICVHSHATLKQCFQGIKANKYHIVAIPCCVPLKLEQSPHEEYEDDSIWSEKNTVKIWRNICLHSGQF